MARYMFPDSTAMANVLYNLGIGRVMKGRDGVSFIVNLTNKELTDLEGTTKSKILKDLKGNIRQVYWEGGSYVMEELYHDLSRKRVKPVDPYKQSNKFSDFRGQTHSNGINVSMVRAEHSTEWLDPRERWDSD